MDNLFALAAQGNAAAIENQSWSAETLNARDASGRTALMLAAIQGNHKVALALKAAGANTALTGPDGRRAVDLAALHGHGLVLASLIDGGCGG